MDASDDRKLWDQVLEELQSSLIPDELRRWFGESIQAADSGGMLTVWVPSETVRRHILTRYQDLIDAALISLDRRGVEVRLIATGVGEDEDEDDL